jgi:uncharacterized protein DUF1559
MIRATTRCLPLGICMLLACATSTILLGVAPAWGDETSPSPDAVIAPFLDDQTIAVAALDVRAPGSVEALRNALALTRIDNPGERELVSTMTVVLSRLIPGIQDSSGVKQIRPVGGTKQIYLIATCSDVLGIFSTTPRPDHSAFNESFFLVVPGLRKEIIQKIRDSMPEGLASEPVDVWACQEIAGCGVIADARLMKRLATLKAIARPDLTAALAAAGQPPLRLAVAPPALFARAASEILLSPVAGSQQPLGTYLASIRWAALGMDLSEDLRYADLVVETGSSDDATRLADFYKNAAPALDKLIADAEKMLPPTEEPVTPLATVGVEGNRVHWTFDKSFRIKMLPILQQKQRTLASLVDTNHLHSIGLALGNYYDVHKQFPDVAIRDAQGKPLLSWRVAVLRYIDDGVLYKQFHLDEPWDSEHNRTLIDKMPNEYRSIETPPGRTRFLAPVGENLAFTEAKGGLTAKSFTDKLSKTIMVVEADPEHAVVWTRPEELVIDLENPRRGLTDGRAEFMIMFGDGAALRLKGSIRPEILRAMLTRNGGEQYSPDDFYPQP